MKYTLLTIFLFCATTSFSQKVVASLPELNVIYLGLESEIEIAVEGYRSEELIKKAQNAELSVKGGKQFIKPLKRGKAYLFVGAKKMDDTLWIDTVEFRARSLPKPKPQMGTLQDGAVQSIGTIRANANRLYLSLSEGFMVRGMRANVLSFRCTIVDSLGFESWEVSGAKTPQLIRSRIFRANPFAKILFSDFKYCVTKNGDTIEFPQKLLGKKVILTVKPKLISSSIIPTEEEKEAYYHYKPTYIITGSFSNTKIAFRYNSIYSREDDLLRLIEKIKVGKWQYFTGDDNEKYLYMEEEYDTIGNLITYKKYDKKSFNKLNITFKKNIDSAFYQEKYPNGNTKKEGWVYKNSKDYINLGELTKNYHGTLSKNPYRNSYEAMKFIPFGGWKEYYENGELKLAASFKTIIDYDYEVYGVNPNSYDANTVLSKGINTVFDGLWLEYDKEGNILNQFLYKDGYFIEKSKR